MVKSEKIKWLPAQVWYLFSLHTFSVLVFLSRWNYSIRTHSLGFCLTKKILQVTLPKGCSRKICELCWSGIHAGQILTPFLSYNTCVVTTVWSRIADDYQNCSVLHCILHLCPKRPLTYLRPVCLIILCFLLVVSLMCNQLPGQTRYQNDVSNWMLTSANLLAHYSNKSHKIIN